MTGYDFDKTIYDGDSFTRFYLYCLARFWYLAVLLPFQGVVLALFGLRVISRKRTKQLFAVYLYLIPNPQRIVQKFWDRHIRRIKPWYLAQKKEDDLIVSASPEFLLAPIMERLGLKNLICTANNVSCRRLMGKNCYGDEKTVRYRAWQLQNPNDKMDVFYSDSLSDLPMMQVAGRGIFVRGNLLEELDLSRFESK